jgi:photosystem II stability/assembly factor-like uncharacterized protein
MRVSPAGLARTAAAFVALWALGTGAAFAATWTAGTPHGLTGPVFADPADPARAYLGPVHTTDAALMYVSDDRGLHWTSRALPEQAGVVAAVAGPPPLLVAAKSESGEIYRSLDQGRTWVTGGCCLIAVDPANPSRMVGYSDGLARSLDGGTTWTPMTVPPVPSLRLDAESFAFDGGGNLWASTLNGAVARTQDFGDTWHVVTGVPEGHLTPVPAVAGVLWSGGWRTGDGGATWQEALRDDVCGQPQVYPVVGSQAAVWATTCGGVFRSLDGGASWTDARVAGATEWLAPLDGGTRGLVVAAGGPWLVEPGTTPSYRGDDLPPAVPSALYADPLRTGRAFAGPFRTDDAASTWRAVSTEAEMPTVVADRLLTQGATDIISTPADGGPSMTLLRGPAHILSGDPSGRRAWLVTRAGLWVTDDGVHATRVPAAGAPSLGREPFDWIDLTSATGARGRTLVYTVHEPETGRSLIAVTRNGGRSFRRWVNRIGIWQIAVDAIDGRLILVVDSGNRLRVSTDGGRRFSVNLRGVRAIAVDSRRRGHWYAARSSRIYETRDAGRTWRRLPRPPGGPIRTIAAGAGRVWAATETRIASLPIEGA